MRKLAILGAIGVVIAVLGAVVALNLGTTNATPISGDSKNTIDVVPANSGVVGLGSNFTVSIDLAEVEATMKYQAMQYKLAWTDALVDYVSEAFVGPAACGTGSPTTGAGTAPGSEAVWDGCAFSLAGHSETGHFYDVTLACKATGAGGVTALTLESIADDSSFGTATASTPGNAQAMVLENGQVTCQAQANLEISKTHTPATVIAGSPFTYNIHEVNLGPNPATLVVTADLVPGEKVVTGTPGVSTACLAAPGPGTCSPVPIAPIMSVTTAINGVPQIPPHCAWFEGFNAAPFGFGFVTNLVLCDYSGTLLPFPQHTFLMGDTLDVAIPVTPPLTDANKYNFNIALAGNLAEPDQDPSDIGCPPVGQLPWNLPPTLTKSIACDIVHVEASALTVTKTGTPDPANAGQTITWTINVSCGAGGSPCANATGTTGPVIADAVSTNQTVINDVYLGAGPGPDANCTIAYPNATCTIPAVMAPGTSQTMTVKTTVDPNLPAVGPCSDSGTVTYADPAVAPFSASVVCQPVVVEIALDKGAWAFPGEITLLVGKSTIVSVVEQIEIIKPGLSPNLLHTWLAFSGGLATFDWQEEVDNPDLSTPVASSQTLGFQTGPYLAPTMFTITKHLNVMCNAVGQDTIHLNLSMVAGNAPADSPATLKVNCVASPSETKVPNQGNLWIMRHPNCVDDDHDGKIDEDPIDFWPNGEPMDNDGDGVANEDPGPCNPYEGKGALVINEVGTAIDDVDSPNDADLDKEGLAAYEKQVKFDHKLVNLTVEDAGFLGSTGRSVNCNLTVITENWILFGCVSTGTQNGPISAVPVTISRIWVTPATDLIERIRPTKDNGVVTPLLDENCEWADKYGDPMAGTVNGGLVPVCGDATITIRMLEGDLNLDCNVDVLDEQAIAFRYGYTFGSLLYDSWFDLEPKVGDFDIDIKDLQFVFGRDGSTCQSPIPLQLPSPPIP